VIGSGEAALLHLHFYPIRWTDERGARNQKGGRNVGESVEFGLATRSENGGCLGFRGIRYGEETNHGQKAGK